MITDAYLRSLGIGNPWSFTSIDLRINAPAHVRQSIVELWQPVLDMLDNSLTELEEGGEFNPNTFFTQLSQYYPIGDGWLKNKRSQDRTVIDEYGLMHYPEDPVQYPHIIITSPKYNDLTIYCYANCVVAFKWGSLDYFVERMD